MVFRTKTYVFFELRYQKKGFPAIYERNLLIKVDKNYHSSSKLYYIPSLVALRFRGFILQILTSFRIQYYLFAALITVSSSLWSSRLPLHVVYAVRYALLRSLEGLAFAHTNGDANVAVSFVSTHYEKVPFIHSLHSSPAVRHVRSLVFAFPRPNKLFLRKSTVCCRLSVSASLCSLVLLASLRQQPKAVGLLPCCRQATRAVEIMTSLYKHIENTENIKLHSLIVIKILNPFNVLALSRLCNLAQNLDKFSKIHLLYITLLW